MSRIGLTLCGRVAVSLEGRPLTGHALGAKGLALLAYLALEPGPHSRAELATLLWGDSPDEKARASLRQSLAHLRQALGDAIDVSRDTVELRATLECDVLALRAAHDGGRRQAVEIDVPRFLADLPVRGSEAFEEWSEATRQSLVRRWRELLAALHREATARHDWREAGVLAGRWLDSDPLSEEAAHAAITAHHMAGERDAAIHLVEAFTARLAAETGRAPSRAMRELAEVVARGAAPRPAGRTRAAAAGRRPVFEGALYGRDAEWEQLHEAWDRAREGAATIVVVEGEAGLGKSRLTADFFRWIEAEGAVVLHARGYEGSDGVAFGVIADALRSVLDAPGLAGTDPQWLAAVAQLLPELRRRFPGLPSPGAAGIGDEWRLHEGLAQLLLALAEESPVALCIDDVQWCDGPSCSALQFLQRRLEHAPFLLCATKTLGVARRDAPGARLARALRNAPEATVIALGPLSADEVWRLVHEIGHIAAPEGARHFAARVHAVTGGNPFYVTELLKTLFDQGWLVADESTGQWLLQHATNDQRNLPLPASVHDALEERIAALPDEARELLLTIAVSGRGCGADILSHVHGVSRLRAAIIADALCEHHLVVEDEGTFRCAHPVIAEVVRTDAGATRRAEVERGLELAATAIAAEAAAAPGATGPAGDGAVSAPATSPRVAPTRGSLESPARELPSRA